MKSIDGLEKANQYLKSKTTAQIKTLAVVDNLLLVSQYADNNHMQDVSLILIKAARHEIDILFKSN